MGVANFARGLLPKAIARTALQQQIEAWQRCWRSWEGMAVNERSLLLAFTLGIPYLGLFIYSIFSFFR